jgi:hypothetical protein
MLRAAWELKLGREANPGGTEIERPAASGLG